MRGVRLDGGGLSGAGEVSVPGSPGHCSKRS